MNIEKILFGAAYYDEYMPCERLEEDVRMMQQLIFLQELNIIKARRFI